MAPRTLKVYSSFRSSDKKAVPEIRLIGQWIEALGFEIGTPVKITTREQLLIIEPLAGQAREEHQYKAVLQEMKDTLKKLG
jgi:hypothetical protein